MSTRLRFTRAMRLVGARDFERVFREGGRARGDCVLVVACPNDSEHTRLGLSVGRRIWKSAVRRNRVRRIFREAFRLSYPDLPVGVDIVMIPAAEKLDPTLAAVREELTALAAKALSRRRSGERPADADRKPGDSPRTTSAGSGAPRRGQARPKSPPARGDA